MKIWMLVLIFLVLALGLLYEGKLIRKSEYWYSVCFFLIITAVFKDGNIMPDYHVYKANYDSIVGNSFTRFIEPGYILISKISSIFGSNGFLVLLFIHIWINLKLLKPIILHDYKNMPYIVLLYISNFYILFGLIQIRAAIALSLFYYSIFFFREIPKKYITTILIATFFHYSALIFLPIIFLKKRIKTVSFLIFIPFGFLVSFYLIEIITHFMDLLPISNIQDKLITYTLESRAEKFKINLTGPFILSKLLLALILFSTRKKLNLGDPFLMILYRLYFLGVLTYFLLSPLPDIAVRISNYFFLSEIFLIPRLINAYSPIKMVKLAIIIFAVFSLLINIEFTTYFNYKIPHNYFRTNILIDQ